VIAAYNANHPVPNAEKYVAEGVAPTIAPEEVAAIEAVVAAEAAVVAPEEAAKADDAAQAE
jgi:hypothetical protein